MQTQNPGDDSRIPLEDIGAAIREGRGLRLAHLYRIVVANEQLNERNLDLSDPVPTGRQILQAAGVRPVADYSIYAILPSGEFEDLRLDETYDLRKRGAERFNLLFCRNRTICHRIGVIHRLLCILLVSHWPKRAAAIGAGFCLAVASEYLAQVDRQDLPH